MKTSSALLALLLLLPTWAKAQFSDDFEAPSLDPAWTNTQDWTLDEQQPIEGSRSLRHGLSGVEGTSYLARGMGAATLRGAATTWRLQLRGGDFDPSSTNSFWFYLWADGPALDAPERSGYAVGVNLSGSDDLLSLWSVRQGAATRLLSSALDWNAGTTASLEVRHDGAGNWELLWAEGSSFDALASAGTAFDSQLGGQGHCGLVFEYTATRAGLLWLDQLSVELQNLPPVLLEASATGPQQVLAVFSEEVDPFSAVDPANFALEGESSGSMAISRIERDAANQVLIYTTPLQTELYTLTTSGVRDLDGAAGLPSQATFGYQVPPAVADLVFNEIMADPSPVVGLPEVEFLELFNRGAQPIDLGGWTLAAGTSIREIPSATVPAGGYVLLSSTAAAEELAAFGQAVGVPSFPSLTNAGASLALRSPQGLRVDSVSYTDDWYQDPDRDEGGYTLERIDPDNLCQGRENWRASQAALGGTPGAANSVLAPNIDRAAPRVLGFGAETPSRLFLLFDEAIWGNALSTSQFDEQSLGRPSAIGWSPEQAERLVLQFDGELALGQAIVLQANGIADFCQNVLADTTLTASYYLPQWHDVIITEIMADESPAVGLPQWEYVEILNRSGFALDLEGWSLGFDESQRPFPAAVLGPGERLVLCREEAALELRWVAPVLAFSSFSLTNGGQTLSLRDQRGRLVHAVRYSDQWYGDDYKAEGGWALEMIDTDYPCVGAENWTASTDPRGGSPGIANSAQASNPSRLLPSLQRVEVLDAQRLLLHFDQSMDSATLLDPTRFQASPGLGNPALALPVAPLYQQVELLFGLPMEPGRIYELRLSEQIRDCEGDALPANTLGRFALPQAALPGDLVINELLFQPFPDGEDFVELLNLSEKVLDLRTLRLASRDEEGALESVKHLSEEGVLLFPGEYAVLCPNTASLAVYPSRDERSFWEVESLPTYANEEGVVVLADAGLVVLDELSYHADMHFPLLASAAGVSLERIDPNAPSHEADNWHSAAQGQGWATPGLPNSQFAQREALADPVRVEPEKISPNNDGYQDFALVHYDFGQPGFVANVWIYDAYGRLARRLVENELLADQGHWQWDGTDFHQQKAPMGVYVILVEVFHPEGEVRQYKLPCVVGGR